MNCSDLSNEEKRQVYAILKTKLRIALDQEFYLEALLLEYAIAEDRLNSILDHLNVNRKNKKGKDIGITFKIDRVRRLISESNLAHKRITIEQLDTIMEWKMIRDDLVHHSCQHLFNNDEVRDCALTGAEVVRLLSNSAQKIKRAVEKQTN